MENVAPDISVRAQLAGARALGEVARLRAIWSSGLTSQSRRTGVISPSSSATAMPMWARWWTRICWPWNEALMLGCRAERERARLDDHVGDGDLGVALERVQLGRAAPRPGPSRPRR